MKELEIAQTMQDNKVVPEQAVQYRTQLAGLYAFYSCLLYTSDAADDAPRV